MEGVGFNLYLDGEEIARIAAGEAMTVYVKPGRHLLTAGPLFSPPATKRLMLQKREATTIRIIDRDGNFELKTAERTWFDSIGSADRSLGH